MSKNPLNDPRAPGLHDLFKFDSHEFDPSRATPLTTRRNVPKTPGIDTPFYHEHALLSAAAYNPTKYEKQYKGLGYDIDQGLSQKSRTVFYNKSTQKAVIAYKGTDPSHLSDLIADGQIANGMAPYLSGRFRGAEKVYRQARRKYGASNVEVTGHSLGGSQAVHIGRKYGAKGIAFEPGVGIHDAYSRATSDLDYNTTLRYLPVNAIHNAISKAMSGPKKHTGVDIVSSAFVPKNPFFNPITAARDDGVKGGVKATIRGAAAAFYDAEYGISALTRLPGAEKRTYVKPKYKNNHKIDNFL